MRSTKSMVATTESKTTAATKIVSKPYKLYTLIGKYRTDGYDTVADFLDTKARRSKQTAFLYASGIKNVNRFIQQKYKDKGYNIQTILPDLKSGKEDVYKLLNSFVTYLQTESTNGKDLTARTIFSYVAAARSYLQYNDIDILPSRFKYKVSMPTIYRGDEEAIDAQDIKEILHHCHNRRLKAYLLVLASGGMRTMEALSLRECDIDFSGINFKDPNDTSQPATLRIRKEYAKTRIERRIFISNEAARYLHDWVNWIYRDKSQDTTTRRITRQRTPDDLIFSRRTYTGVYPTGLYNRLLGEFQRVLELSHLSTRKQDGVYKRRKITFHSFRRFVKTTIANQTHNSDFSEWFLGHSKSSYYTTKHHELKRIYKEDCMRYLTFLDYPTLEATGRSYEALIKQKDTEIEELNSEIRLLKQRDNSNTGAIGKLQSEMSILHSELTKVQDEYSNTKQLFSRFISTQRKFVEERKQKEKSNPTKPS
jgi:integrase